jgi:hypothetical protein
MRLSPQTGQERDADMPNGGTSAPPVFGETTQNRGNEAKNSLKANEVGKTMCAKPTHSCAQNASKPSEETADSRQSPAAGGQDSAPGRPSGGAGTVLNGSGRVDTQTPSQETDIITESPLNFQI